MIPEDYTIREIGRIIVPDYIRDKYGLEETILLSICSPMVIKPAKDWINFLRRQGALFLGSEGIELAKKVAKELEIGFQYLSFGKDGKNIWIIRPFGSYGFESYPMSLSFVIDPTFRVLKFSQNIGPG